MVLEQEEGTGAGGKEQTNQRKVSNRVNRFASLCILRTCLSGGESRHLYVSYRGWPRAKPET